MHEHGPNCLEGPIRGSHPWWRGLALTHEPAELAGILPRDLNEPIDPPVRAFRAALCPAGSGQNGARGQRVLVFRSEGDVSSSNPMVAFVENRLCTNNGSVAQKPIDPLPPGDWVATSGGGPGAVWFR